MAISDDAELTSKYYKELPKVELHRHLEGSLRFETIQEIAITLGLPFPLRNQLIKSVQYQSEDPRTFSNFLAKFVPLRQLYRSQEIIRRVTREAIEDAAEDNVRYLELRFSPVALSRAQGFTLAQVIDWVLGSAAEAARDFDISTRLIVTINRHEDVDQAAEIAYLASERCRDGIVGLDLAGNEADFSVTPFQSIILRAHKSGLHMSIHAGEWGPGENVTYALEHLSADRIGHGIRVIESQHAIELAHQKNTVFEICPTSNYQSGAVVSMDAHPLRKMLDHGLNITINTDDPGISQISLSSEYQLICQDLGISHPQLCEMNVAAAQAAFIPLAEREVLAEKIRTEFMSDAGIET